MEVLREIINKNLIEILDLFLNNPEKKFSLTEASRETKVNITATFRILNKLVSKKLLKSIPHGKIKLYRLEENEKTLYLLKLIEKDITPIEKFVQELSRFDEIKKIILNSREKNNANLLIIGEELPMEKIKDASEKINKSYNYIINFAILTEIQYEALKNFKNYNLDKNTILDNTIEAR